jgi:sugar-phosphatase
LLFDLDGTLVDSTDQISKCWRSWAIENNFDPEKVNLISRGRTAKETISLVVSPEADIDSIADAFIGREIQSAQGISALHCAKQLIDALPIDKWGVVTSATTSLASARLSSAGLPIPSVLVTSDSVVKGKPAPDSYLLAAQLLGAQTRDCLVFEDSKSGIEAAISAGIPVIHVNRQEAVEGVLCSIKDYAGVSIALTVDGLIVEIND